MAMKRLMSLWQAWLQQKRVATTKHELHLVVLPAGEEVLVSHTADCVGAACPRPQMVTMRMLETMKKGDVLELVSDNPTTVETIPALAMTLYCRHLATVHTNSGWYIYIRKDDERNAGI